jgi:hypothetical protein
MRASRRLAGRDETKVEGANDSVASGGDERAHVELQRGPARGLPDDSHASEGAAVTVERSHPDERRDLLAIQPSEFGEVGEERAADNGTDAGDGAEQVLFRPPDGLFWIQLVGVALYTRQRAHPRFQFHGYETASNHIISAGVDAFHAVLDRREAGDQHDRNQAGCGLSFGRRHTSKPSRCGMLTSSKTTSGRSRMSAASAHALPYGLHCVIRGVR